MGLCSTSLLSMRAQPSLASTAVTAATAATAVTATTAATAEDAHSAPQKCSLVSSSVMNGRSAMAPLWPYALQSLIQLQQFLAPQACTSLVLLPLHLQELPGKLDSSLNSDISELSQLCAASHCF